MTKKKLNRIRIKDMVAVLKQDVDVDSPMGLVWLDLLNKKEEYALIDPSEEMVRGIEQFFIERKLGIRYHPKQNKKVLSGGTVVPIEQIYGSENA